MSTDRVSSHSTASILVKACAACVAATLAAASLVAASAPVLAATGDITEFGMPGGSAPDSVAVGPDGNLWVTGVATSTVSRVTPAGDVTTFATQTAAANPRSITAGPDGNMWFTEQTVNKIGRVSMAGVMTEFLIPTAASQPMGIAAGADGALWFTELMGNRIGRITTGGVITEYAIPTAASGPAMITAGPEGSNRLYFTEYLKNKVAFITTAGAITEAVSMDFGTGPLGIATIGGSVWFVESSKNNLSRLINDTTVARISLGAGVGPRFLTGGPGSTIWVTADGANQIREFTDQEPRWRSTPCQPRCRTRMDSRLVPTGISGSLCRESARWRESCPARCRR